ncbi:MAG TPA: thiamine phosphate synthase [Chloroflexota bacterium]|nr:thiamine phosphate synthase [Chloroflexota bacterium]
MNLGGVHLVTDRALCPLDRLGVVVDEAVRGGITAIHLRDRDLPARDMVRLAVSLREVIAGRALLFVNDRVDVALASAADGVQLGESSLPVADARRVAGQRLLLGRSVHSLDGACRAADDGADFVVLGTIFASRSHPGQAGAGVALVRSVRDVVRVPIIAIGGIDERNAGEVMRAGADGVAVISAILGSDDVLAATRRLAAVVERGASRAGSSPLEGGQ